VGRRLLSDQLRERDADRGAVDDADRDVAGLRLRISARGRPRGVDGLVAMQGETTRYVEVQNLVKWFGSDRAVDDISFGISRGKFLTLLGPSGCGKTTTLMSIAGLVGIDAGLIRVGGLTYTSKAEGILLPPEKRDIGMVFQSYAVWPHMTVRQNV